MTTLQSNTREAAARATGTPGTFSLHNAARARRRTAAWNGCARAVIWGTSIVVVALWVSGRGIQGVLGFDAETLNSLSRLAGLVSANLLLYQVLLMARIPLFERGFGRDAITRFHRIVGMWSVVLLVLHAVLIWFGYALQDGLGLLAEAADLIWNYPGMLIAVVGSLLVLGVAVSSARRSRRRMRYESWHLLHLYAYLGVGLAVPHMLWTGADFLASPAATVYWWGLWIITAAAVMIFRVLRPLWRGARAGLRVVQVRPDGSSAVAVRVQGPGVGKLSPRAGQFFVWRFLSGAGWSRGHPFSLAAAPTATELELSARIVGDGTRRLASIRPGTRVMVEGPFGLFTNEQRRHPRVLMLGAGAGVAPLVSLLEAGDWQPGEAVLVTRDHDPAGRVRGGEIAQLCSQRGLQHYVLDGPRAQGASSWISAAAAGWDGADLLRYFMPAGGASDVFVCGPETWMRDVIRDLRRLGVPAKDIHSELFTV